MTSLSTNNLENRTRPLSKNFEHRGECVLYIMSRDRRTEFNYALAAAQRQAIALNLPLAVVYCMYRIDGRAREHARFIIDGLKEVESDLAELNIPLMMLIGKPEDVLPGVINHTKPSVVYVDFNPLNHAKEWQAELAKLTPVVQVDSHNAVPVWLASSKQEIGARTLRPKIHRLLKDYSVKPPALTKHPYKWPGKVLSLNELNSMINKVINSYKPNNTVINYKSGPRAAREHLRGFIYSKLVNYSTNRNNPALDGLSGLSPYLHYGHISSLEVLLKAQSAVLGDSSLQTGYDALLEEMIIRKELSDNYCFYNSNYKSLDGAPNWAIKTLKKHSSDPREHLYTNQDFLQAKTHDLAWNAAQTQLLKTGKIHGYMRMYWAKKVLEWSNSPEEAIDTLINLNDFYSIDGGDPNGYVGILWSVAGLHDRPWGERPVYGTVRSMVYSGLKRKFPVEEYIKSYS
jgi:deoxyribodipyrimidine photo-lyase